MARTSGSLVWVAGGFGVIGIIVLGVITAVRSGGDPQDQQNNSAAAADSACGELIDMLDAGIDFDDEDLTDEWDPFSERVALQCAGESGAVIVVEGLPDVAGVYATVNGDLALTGMGNLEFEHGRCFVGNEGDSFQTKAIRKNEQDGSLVTIDVGVSGSGDPFVAVVREFVELDGEPELLSSEVTHDYQAAAYRQNAVINVTSARNDDWAGQAMVESTFYNIRDYFPYTDKQWEGNPIFNGRIRVLCGTGTTVTE